MAETREKITFLVSKEQKGAKRKTYTIYQYI